RLGRARRGAHPLELELVLGTAHAYQGVAQLGVRCGCGAQAAGRPAAEPALELAERPRPPGDSLAVAFQPAPEQLLRGHGLDELGPALARIERDDAAGTLAVGQVQVLGVRPERVSAVAAARDEELVAGLDEHDAVAEPPR